MSAPKGFLGARWGEGADAVVARLGLAPHWQTWEGGPEYEASFDVDHPAEAFGRSVLVRLFRRGARLEGLSLRFMRCGATQPELATAIREQFGLREAEEPIYKIWWRGSLVHLRYDSGDDTCVLTIAGPAFGKAFAAYLLEQGFNTLAYGLRSN
jgi:hypothetical protein